jgi:PAS domain S-box-containing protein
MNELEHSKNCDGSGPADCLNGSEKAKRTGIGVGQRPVFLLAFFLGLFSIICALGIAFLAYRHHLKTAIEQNQQACFNDIKILAAEHAPLSDEEYLKRVMSRWNAQTIDTPDKYMCIFDENGRLVLHTARSESVGNYVGGDHLISNGGPFGSLNDLIVSGKGYAGDYVSSAGEEQIVAFTHIPERGWVAGIHQSKAALVEKVYLDIRPMLIGFVVICGLIMPGALVLLTYMFFISWRRKSEVEESLRESEQNLAKAQQIAHLGSWEWDIQGGDIYWSEEMFRIFWIDKGIGPSNELAREKMHEGDRQLFDDGIADLLGGKAIDGIESRLVGPEGQIRYIHTIGEMHLDESGKPVRAVGTVQDITDRKMMEKERKKLREDLFQTQKMENIGLLAGGIAHDFNNLLQGIIGYIQLIMARMDESDVNYPELNLIEVAADKAAGLTRQLLSFSRKGQDDTAPLLICETVNQVVLLIERTFEKNIMINVKIPREISCVKANEGQLHQALLNLCMNARDAMPDGGTLTISAEEKSVDEDYCMSRPDAYPGKYVLLCVADTGTGMTSATRSKIFEPFFTTKDADKGTGLGLSMIYSIIKNHGGFIEVDSVLGEGTTFKVFLPATTANMTDATKEGPESLLLNNNDAKFVRDGGGKRVLVVDDEDVVRYLAVDLLSNLGYETIPAEDGQAAIEIAQEQTEDIDLVLLDLVMPNLSGEETFRKLREIVPDVPVIILSGYSRNQKVQSLLDEGANGFIQKPYNFQELTGTIHSVLDDI